ncbi:MAG: SulP family inorganic anion transporter [Alphaproteobacteria bacterium]|jgi:sulfate permease, SulP family|nr:SulP family inorganic anion transporter [Alphaproteobacteria bacterium]MBU2040715.1 SulP family inorganic anion transporter [Alphaproteobacteria bacterium]MBU2207764.1 SulP family inorganic anion transporter [Alphaproteobacteria bacterium]MBU2290790.1 SulP family inorganic anion transporter [Alphaproteobacteria bacterium]MBU2397318.1 SulP family inorganic anion transporter [Alphaproteobacteria bacterium]
MSVIASARQQWLANPRRDLLAGTVVALALIPEAIAFSIIAGVDPSVGLYASFVIAVTIAFVGGRPAMISAATGAMALLMVTLVRDHGIEYLFAASLLTGVFQILVGVAKLGRYIKFVSRSVMTGFVNSLAILIFLAQMPELIGANWQTFALVGAALAIIYGLPRLTKAVPSPLVAIVLLSGFVIGSGLDVRTVGDMGQMPSTLPMFHIPAVPLTWETLVIIGPIAATLAFVGLLESLLTANLLDDITDTPSDKDRETRGQGIANIASSLFGGMAGCAMIGQSIINVTSGARGRLSTLWAGLCLLFLILVLQDWVSQIPMAALVAVMIMVSVGTFDWKSVVKLRSTPVQSSIVMVATTATVVITHDLSKGVVLGVILSAVFFMRKVGKTVVVEEIPTPEEGVLRYRVTGQLFFASADVFAAAFEHHGHPARVEIDMTGAHLWDLTGVAAVDKVVFRYRRQGAAVEVIGMNEAGRTLIDRVGKHDKDHLPAVAGH